MITDDHYDGNYQERSSCVRCPDLWRSQSSVPEEQQYHTWLTMITTMDFVRKQYISLCHLSSSTTTHWPHSCPSPRCLYCADSTSPCHSHYLQGNHNQDEDGTWRRSTVAYKRGSFVMSWKPVLHCEMATKEGTSRRARMAKMISLFQ